MLRTSRILFSLTIIGLVFFSAHHVFARKQSISYGPIPPSDATATQCDPGEEGLIPLEGNRYSEICIGGWSDTGLRSLEGDYDTADTPTLQAFRVTWDLNFDADPNVPERAFAATTMCFKSKCKIAYPAQHGTSTHDTGSFNIDELAPGLNNHDYDTAASYVAMVSEIIDGTLTVNSLVVEGRTVSVDSFQVNSSNTNPASVIIGQPFTVSWEINDAQDTILFPRLYWAGPVTEQNGASSPVKVDDIDGKVFTLDSAGTAEFEVCGFGPSGVPDPLTGTGQKFECSGNVLDASDPVVGDVPGVQRPWTPEDRFVSSTGCDTTVPDDKFHVCYFNQPSDPATSNDIPLGSEPVLTQNEDLSIGAPGGPVNDGDWNVFDYNWPNGTNIGTTSQNDHVSAVWRGNIKFSSGKYVFHADSDDGVEIWVDGTYLPFDVPAWQNHPNGFTRNSAEQTFNTTDYHQIEVRYYESTGDASLRVWATFSGPVSGGLPPSAAGGGGPGNQPPNYCSSGPDETINWTYSDPVNSPQSAYQVQVDLNSGDFSSPVFDTGKIISSSNAYGLGPGVLSYNHTYKARVMVWNSSNTPSAWAGTANWSTPAYAYPQVEFTWSPSNPVKDQSVQFTDETTCGGGGCSAWKWFLDLSNNPALTSTQQNPTHAYTTESNFTILLQATDPSGHKCSATKTLSVHKPVPIIKEVAPK